MTKHLTPTAHLFESADLHQLLKAGGIWHLAPKWVPRTGYAPVTPELLKALASGLRRKLR